MSRSTTRFGVFDVEKPYGIAVNKEFDSIYWTQEVGAYDVLSSKFDGGDLTVSLQALSLFCFGPSKGSSKRSVLQIHIGYNGIARGITVDEVTQYMYYVDDSGKKIQEANAQNTTGSWKFMSWDPELGTVNYLDIDFNTHYLYWGAT